MNKAILAVTLWACSVSVCLASQHEADAGTIQQTDPVIHIDSRQLDADFGHNVYRISLSPVTKRDYKLLGLSRHADTAGYSSFVYCALRKVAVGRGFGYWLLLPSRSADAGYVSYVQTEAEAKYIAEKSLGRLVIYSVHKPPAAVRQCGGNA